MMGQVTQTSQNAGKVIAYRTLDRHGNPVTYWIDGDPAGNEPIVPGGSFQLAYDAPTDVLAERLRKTVGGEWKSDRRGCIEGRSDALLFADFNQSSDQGRIEYAYTNQIDGADPIRPDPIDQTVPAITNAAQLCELLGNVKALHDMSVELIAVDVFRQLGDGKHGLTAAAADVLAERRRMGEVVGWMPEFYDEHAYDELAALACFYAMPPAAREWDASSTGYGSKLGAAILPIPIECLASPGDRRRELVKAGGLILADIELLDRASEANLQEQQP